MNLNVTIFHQAKKQDLSNVISQQNGSLFRGDYALLQ